MDTDRLKYFVAVVDAGGLTKASQVLNISHSGLSKAISVLEAETGFDLFRPLGRGLEITEDGKWLYQKAQEMLKIAGEIQSQQKEMGPSFLRVGLSEVIAVTCAGLLAAEFEKAVMFQELEVGEVEGKIVSGEIDFGIAFIPSPKPELEYLAVGEVQFDSYAREDLLKAHSALDLPFIVPISDFPTNPSGYKARDGWPKQNERKPWFSVSSFAIALDLLRSARGAVYMPSFIADLENLRNSGQPKIIRSPQHSETRAKRRIFLIKRHSAPESKEMKRASRLIRRVCCLK